FGVGIVRAGMRIIIVILTLAALTAGCSHGSKSAAVSTGPCDGHGVVQGTLRVIGGPFPGVNRGEPGGVVATDKARHPGSAPAPPSFISRPACTPCSGRRPA